MGSALSCIHGSTISSQSQQPAPPPPEPARVIAPDGTLKELLPASAPIASVSDVLGSGASSFFVCNSDALYFNEPPPALAAAERLRPGQMYFVLPAEMLGRPLSAADMAALAVRATAALGPGDDRPPQPRRRPRGRVVPVPVTRLEGEDRDERSVFYETLNELTLGGGSAAFTFTAADPARSAGKVTAVASGKTKRSSSSFKRMLSMIREDAE